MYYLLSDFVSFVFVYSVVYLAMRKGSKYSFVSWYNLCVFFLSFVVYYFVSMFLGFIF